MSERCLITTFPIGARVQETTSVPKLGLLVPGTIGDFIRRRFSDTAFTLAINAIDTYRNRYPLVRPLISSHNHIGINPDSHWIDSEHILELHEQIHKLYTQGYLNDEDATTLRCSDACLKVEMLIDDNFIPQAGRVFSHNANGQLICRECQHTLKSTISRELVMTFPHDLESPLVYPESLSKDVAEITRRTRGMRMLISRKRPTGIQFEINDKQYNIDIDFFWFNYLNTIAKEHKDIIMIGSNHVRRHLTHINAIYQTVNTHSATRARVHLVTPFYILPSEELAWYTNGGYLDAPIGDLARFLILSSTSFKQDRLWQFDFFELAKKKLKSATWVGYRDLMIHSGSGVQENLHQAFRLLNSNNIRSALKGTPTSPRKVHTRDYDVQGII